MMAAQLVQEETAPADAEWHTTESGTMRYVFGDYVLDTQRYELSCAGKPVSVRPKVCEVLAYLLAHRDRLVSKDELSERLWPGQYARDATLNSCILEVRKAIGDSGQAPACCARCVAAAIALWRQRKSRRRRRHRPPLLPPFPTPVRRPAPWP